MNTTVKRIVTLALAAILVLGLVIPALAATEKGGTLTITNTVDTGTVYDVYKMFTVEDGNTTAENLYKVGADWKSFVTTDADAYFDLDATGEYVNFVKATTTTADAAVIAELAKNYATKAGSPAQKLTTVTVNGAAVTLEENGYYLLVPNSGVSGVIVVKNGEDKSIVEKSTAPGVPQLTKEVWEDTAQKYGKENTVEIGEDSQYKVTVLAGEGASHYVLHDQMDEHIAFKKDTVKVTRGGNDVATSDYDVVTEGLTDGCTFHIVFHQDWCTSLNKGATIVVTYNGTLLAQAMDNGVLTDVETATDHENTAWLSYTDQPGIETEADSVATQTYEINVLKVDQNDRPLAGAGFVLKDNMNKYYAIVDNQVDWVDDIEAATVKTSDAEGKLAFYGVDAEIFQLVEKVVPGGYTGVGDTQVSTKGADEFHGKNVSAANPAIVKNVLGNALPETGGIGTTVFYVLGGILVIGALAVLAVMKRKETSAQ